MKKEEIKISIENEGELLELVSEKIHNHWMIWAKELIASEPNISTERKTAGKVNAFSTMKI